MRCWECNQHDTYNFGHLCKDCKDKREKSKTESTEPEKPNEPFTEACPECKGNLAMLYKHGVWSCSSCKIKIRQSREEGIVSIEPLMTFSVSPLEIK